MLMSNLIHTAETLVPLKHKMMGKNQALFGVLVVFGGLVRDSSNRVRNESSHLKMDIK